MRIRLTLICSLCLWITFSGCTQAEKLHTKKFVIAGTYVEVTSAHPDANRIVFETMRGLEKVFNLYDASSDLSRLNAAAGIEPVRVDRALIEAILLSKQLHQLTHGAFDPSIGTTISFWKEKISQGRLERFPSTEEIEAMLRGGGMDHVQIDEGENTAFIDKEGVILDLGGIAKGFMVDKAISALKEKGIDSALINAGGDMFCLGSKDGQPWNIGIRDPGTLAGIMETLKIKDEAIATSGDYEQFFLYDDKRYSHIIDPRTALPVSGPIRSITVIAANATTADGLATAFFILGKAEIMRFIQDGKSTLKVFVVEETGEGRIQIHCLGPLF
ncbi:FAD:protein FMN transferase [Candidatus Omnitrophota bacterium]